MEDTAGVEGFAFAGEHEGRDACFLECLIELLAIDLDVGDMQAVLCEFRTGDDEAPMSVRRDESFR